MDFLRKVLLCKILQRHDPTSPAIEAKGEIPPEYLPTAEDSPREKVDKFNAYTRIACRRCGVVIREGLRQPKEGKSWTKKLWTVIREKNDRSSTSEERATFARRK